MRKKLALLMASLFLIVGTAWAQIPVASPAPAGGQWSSGTRWYTIQCNDDSKGYVSLCHVDANGNLLLNNSSKPTTAHGLWCVVGDDANGYQFYNCASGASMVLGGTGSQDGGRLKMYDAEGGKNGVTYKFDIKKIDGQNGYAFVKNQGSANDWWNHRGNYLAYWNTSSACNAGCTGSQFVFTEVSSAELETMATNYKTSALAILSSLATLFDVSAIQTAIENVNLADAAALATIISEFEKIGDKRIAFRNGDPNHQNRKNAYLAARPNREKGYGTQAHANWGNIVWSLKLVKGSTFALYNEVQELYLGSPSSNGALSAVPTTGYTVEVIDEASKTVEFKWGEETLHLNNHNDGFLSNHDNNDNASRWYIETDLSARLTEYKTAISGLVEEATTLAEDTRLGTSAERTNLNAALAKVASDDLVTVGKAVLELPALMEAAIAYIRETDVTYITALDFTENSNHPIIVNNKRSNWGVAANPTALSTLNDLRLAKSSVDTKQQFAIITPDNGANYYLYSIHAQRYLKSDNTFSTQGEPIAFADASSKGENKVQVRFRDVAQKYFNVGGDNQMVINYYNTIDDGNACEIVQYNTLEFDLDYALKVLNEGAQTTVKYMRGEEQVFLQNELLFVGDTKNLSLYAAKVISVTVNGTPLTAPAGNANWKYTVEEVGPKEIIVNIEQETCWFALQSPASPATYFNFTAKTVDGLETKASFQTTPSYLTITPSDNGYSYVLKNKEDATVAIGSTHGWCVTNSESLWLISEADENGLVTISRKGDANKRLGSDDNTSDETPIFTNVGSNCNKWKIVKAYPLTIVYKYNGLELGEESTVVLDNAEYTIELGNEYADKLIASCVATNDVVVEENSGVWTLLATAASTVTVELKKGAYVPAVGDYIRFQSRAKGGYMKAMDDDMIRRTADKTDGTTLWLVEAGDNGSVKLKNFATQKYMGGISQSYDVKLKDVANAAQFTFSKATGEFMLLQETGKGDYAYANMNEWSGAYKVVGWEKDDQASHWLISQAYPLTLNWENGKEIKAVDAGFYSLSDKDAPEGKAIASCSMGGNEIPKVSGGWPVVVNGATEVTLTLNVEQPLITGDGTVKPIPVSSINNQNLASITEGKGWTVSLDVKNPNGVTLNQWGTPILVMGDNTENKTFQLYLRATTNNTEPNKLCLVLQGKDNYIPNVTASGNFQATIMYDGNTTVKVQTTNANGNTVTNTFTVSAALPEFNQFVSKMPVGMDIQNLNIALWQNEFDYTTTAGVINNKYIFTSDKLWYNGLCNRLRFNLTGSAAKYANGKKRLSFDSFELRDAEGNKIELFESNFSGNYSKPYANMLDGIDGTYCCGNYNAADEGDDWFEICLPKGTDLGGAFTFSFITENKDMNAQAFNIKVSLDYTYLGVVTPGTQEVEVTYDGQPLNINQVIKDYDPAKLNATDLTNEGCAWEAQLDNDNATIKVVYKRTHYIFGVEAPQDVNVTYNGNAIENGDLLDVTFNPNNFAAPAIDGYVWNLVFDKEQGTATIVYTEVVPEENPQAVVDLLARVGGWDAVDKFKFVLNPLINTTQETFVIGSENGKILIKGTTISAITTGIGWYLNNIAKINIAWNSLNEKTVSGAAYADLSNLPLPATEETHTSDAKYRYYLNYCTFGYSMTSWTWKRWQQEIDWMALHGINMPLQIVGLEEVWRKFLTLEEGGQRKYNYTDEEAKAFVAGPAFTAWWGMNNLEGWGGTGNDGWGGVQDDAWYKRQQALATQILTLQRDLGMQPVLPGFSGMVPSNFGTKNSISTNDNGKYWSSFTRPHIVKPTSDRFAGIAADYYACLREVMGESQYYSMDPFHEGGGTASNGDYTLIYNAMEAAKPGSQWVIQQWQWEGKSQKLSLSDVPAGKLIVLDLFSDGRPEFDEYGYNGYAPQDAVFCAIPNFGGRSGLMGRLQNVTKNYFTYKAKHKTIKGIGTAPEAIEQTPVAYDLIYQLPWMNGEEPNVEEWVNNYSIARYGKDNAVVKEAWSLLRQGPLNYGADAIQGPVEDVWAARPNLEACAASSWGSTISRGHRIPAPGLTYTKERRQMLIDAVYKLIDQEDELELTDGSVYKSNYNYDLVEFGGAVIADYAHDLLLGIKEAKDASNTDLYNARKNAFLQLILDMDEFRGTNLNFRLGKWTQEARDAAKEAKTYGATIANEDWYEFNNARTILTTWGDQSQNSGLKDYSYRSWQGLLKDYYYPRWEYYFNNDCNGTNYFFFEWNWAHGMTHQVGDSQKSTTRLSEGATGYSYTREPEGNTVDIAKSMLAKYIIPVYNNGTTYYAYRTFTTDLTDKATVNTTSGSSVDFTKFFNVPADAVVTGDFINNNDKSANIKAVPTVGAEGTYTGTITIADGTVLQNFTVVLTEPQLNGYYNIYYKGTPLFIGYNEVDDDWVEGDDHKGYKILGADVYTTDAVADKIFSIVPQGDGFTITAQGKTLKSPNFDGWNHIQFSDDEDLAGIYKFHKQPDLAYAYKIQGIGENNGDEWTHCDYLEVYSGSIVGNNSETIWDSEKEVSVEKASIFTLTPVTEYTLTVPASGYAAVCLPFNVVLPEGVEAYDINSLEKQKLVSGEVLEKIAGAGEIVMAGTPMVVKATAGDHTLGITMESEGAKTSLEGSVLRGNFVKQNLAVSAEHKIYELNGDVWTLLETGKDIPANTCWIEAPKNIDYDYNIDMTPEFVEFGGWKFRYEPATNGIMLTDAAINNGDGELEIPAAVTVAGMDEPQKVVAIAPDFLHGNTKLTSITIPATMVNLGFRKVEHMFGDDTTVYEGAEGDGGQYDGNEAVGEVKGAHREYVFPIDPVTKKPFMVESSFAWRLTLDVTIDDPELNFNNYGSAIVSTHKNSLADSYTDGDMQIYMKAGHKDIMVKIDNADDRYRYTLPELDANGNETGELVAHDHFILELEHDGSGGYQVVVYYDDGRAKMYNISASEGAQVKNFDRLYYSLPQGIRVKVKVEKLISEGLFVGCTNLREIKVHKDNPTFKSCEHGVLYDKQGYYVMRIPEGDPGTLVNGRKHFEIPSKVVKLYAGAVHGVNADIVLHSNPQIGVVEGHEHAVENANFYLSLDDIDNTITEKETGYGGARDFISANTNKYKSANYKRAPLAKGVYGTLCLPFDILEGNAIMKKYDFYKLKGGNASSLTFTQVTELEHNKPYLYTLKDGVETNSDVTEGLDVFQSAGGVTIETLAKYDPNSHDKGTCEALGSFINFYVETAGKSSYYYYLNADTNKFHRVTKKLNYRPYRAIFVVTPENQAAQAPSRLNLELLDGTVTEIDASLVEGMEAPEYYDLSGRRVLNPVSGGVYIQNGKKVFIK